MISLKSVYLAYTKDYFTLNNINLEVASGEKIILFGEKESGKSSLVRVLANLEKVTSGEVIINDKPISDISFRHDINLGYLSSFGAFLGRKTVKQNLEYILKIRKFDKGDIAQKVNACILVNKLQNIATLKINQLSVFDKLRVAIARLTMRPLDYLIIDDIFENVDDDEKLILLELIESLINKNKLCTSVIAVNDEKIAKKLNGRVININYGSIVE